MKLQTKHFGEIEIQEEKIITFEDGLPGFPDDKQYILLEDQQSGLESGMFYWLQSTTDGKVAFILMDTIAFMPEYDPLVNKEDVASLGEYDPDDFLIYNVVVLPEDVKDMTVNLAAPVVINSKLRKGKQVVVTNEEYGIRHFVFRNMEKSNV